MESAGRNRVLSALSTAAGKGIIVAKRMSESLGTFGDREPRNRALVVTINRPPGEFPDPGHLPEPVRRLGDRAEIIIRPAPDGQRTELGLRLRHQPPPGQTSLAARLAGDDPRAELRAALRDAKSLIEAGEVIQPDQPPATHPSPAGRILELATRRAGAEGRL